VTAIIKAGALVRLTHSLKVPHTTIIRWNKEWRPEPASLHLIDANNAPVYKMYNINTTR
jgi:hypothetical protein